ncbi:TetR family transcriptional regulator C-terminal domain-containing protein [Actinocorallia libanotica]
MSGEATSPEHPAHAYYTERYRNLRRFYTAVFTALAERGELRSPVAPAVLATMTISLLNGLQAQWLHDRGTVDMAGSLHAFPVTFVPAVGD